MYFREHPGSWRAMFPTGSPSLVGSRLLRLLSLEAMLAGCIFLRVLFISPPPVSQFAGTIIFRIHLLSYKVCSLVSWAIFLVVCLLTVFARKVLPDTGYITLNKEKTGVGPSFVALPSSFGSTVLSHLQLST